MNVHILSSFFFLFFSSVFLFVNEAIQNSSNVLLLDFIVFSV
jgi:hypothetical protein